MPPSWALRNRYTASSWETRCKGSAPNAFCMVMMPVEPSVTVCMDSPSACTVIDVFGITIRRYAAYYPTNMIWCMVIADKALGPLGDSQCERRTSMKLFHGSSTAIEHPDVTFNKGFSDLGQGFYLTDNRETAKLRAQSRARIDGTCAGVVSAYSFNEDAIAWFTWGDNDKAGDGPFGLRFDANQAGIAAWANYIKACRHGRTAVPGRGQPAVVRAWIATEDVEMVCSGFAPADVLATFIEPASLIVQYCFRDQQILDQLLSFDTSFSV